jgi:hypothetical protein
MTEMLAITTLRTKRAEIADALEGLGRQVEQRRTDLMHVDATLRLFDSDAAAVPGPKGPARKRNDWFQPGECRRRIHDVLRDAVTPVTTRAIVEAVMAAKTLPADDNRARELIHKTVLSSLNRATDTIERTQSAGSAAWRVI